MPVLPVLLVLLFVTLSSAIAQLAKHPPVPQRLGVDTAPLTSTFQHEGKLLRAILLVVSDQPVIVRLNDRELGRLPAGTTAESIDLTDAIKAGPNVIELASAYAKVAALLELNGDLTKTQWLATDATWRNAQSLGPVDIEGQTNPFDFKKTFDAYNSWQLAKTTNQVAATDPASFTVPPDFGVELIRSATVEDGSWVAMAFDPQGRITLAREKKGLLRFDLGTKAMTLINDSLLECRGLLYAHSALYANANNSKGLYRLRDTNGDGAFDESSELLHTEGGVGHGRNHIKLGPDGDIYIAHGNNVLLPKIIASDSPLSNYANDQLLPNPWDGSMFDGNVELPAGHVLKMNPDGSKVTLVAGGLRNPLDIAFNGDGELFTFDADMERDLSAHWYVPTRVLHVVPGADYGWRHGTGRYPAYYVDTLPSVLDVGLASPTGTFFGYGSQFPEAYRDALFILDWSYGRIIAVQLTAHGASYKGSQQTFVSGRPLNVTDGCIGPDGSLWFITGGRGTQSGLYRVSYRGKHSQIAAPAPPAPRVKPRPDLGSSDAFQRHAALMELESGKVSISTSSPWSAIMQALAKARGKDRDARGIAIQDAINWLGNKVHQTDHDLAALRIISIAISRGHQLGKADRDQLVDVATARWSDAVDPRMRWELTKLLVYLQSPTVISKACGFLKTATASEDLLFYPLHLRYLKSGWTLDHRRVVFEALNRAEQLNGASSYFKAITDTRAELVATLNADEALQLAELIVPKKPVELSPHAMPGHSYKAWTLADLEPLLAKPAQPRSYDQAKAALVSTQCVFCHRVAADNHLPAGIIGPDLTQVAARFGRRDLLMHILTPSLVIDEKFRSTILTKVDGQRVIGTLDSEDDERIVLKPNPLAKEVIETAKAQVKSRAESPISSMPTGLLNGLKAEQILDLLAWFEASGDPKHAVWGR
jgi:putative heme-binding domain-containing protein